MNPDIDISVVEDTATPAVEALAKAMMLARVQDAVGTALVGLFQDHLNALGPNARGWPSTNFYAGAAAGTDWSPKDDGVLIACDNEKRPGALRQRYFGGTIRMKDKMLAIPARAEFYAHSPTEFTNLRLAIFHGGSMALVVGTGGAGRVNFQTGREQNVKGAGARSAAMVAFWLKEEVHQDADKSVLPDHSKIIDAALGAVIELAVDAGAKKA